MQKLKPCPFCGRSVLVDVQPSSSGGYSYKNYTAKCDYCEVKMGASDRAALEERWNSRHVARDPVLFRPAGEHSVSVDLVEHLHRQRDFSLRTFGPGPRLEGVIAHIRKELAEIEAKPTDVTEWIDVVLLALDGAWRAGFGPEEIAIALQGKQAKNEARTWPDWRTAAPGAPIEHDRTGEVPAGGAL
jgi:hypothetical protein